MKEVIVVSGPEVQEAVLKMLGNRRTLAGKFVGAVHLVSDPEADPALRIRANVVLFDTEKAAREYEGDAVSQTDSLAIVRNPE